MTAPDLRPTATTDAAAPMETGPDHQLEHQMPGEELVPTIGHGPVDAWVCRLCGKFCTAPNASTCMVGKANGCPMVAPEPLAKVLPAGCPILGGHQ